jgi:outer membrane lipopolysaccharide assembly protein LptE/RlpB
MTRRLSVFALSVLLLSLGACSSYHLGTGTEPKFSRLFIAPVGSEVLVPQAKATVTTQLRESFLKDGRVALADSAAEADAVLTIKLTGYGRDTTVARADDTGLARRFDVSLRARATLTDRRTGKDLFTNRPFTAKRGVFTDSGQLQSEYQALPLLAAELARQTVQAALDSW